MSGEITATVEKGVGQCGSKCGTIVHGQNTSKPRLQCERRSEKLSQWAAALVRSVLLAALGSQWGRGPHDCRDQESANFQNCASRTSMHAPMQTHMRVNSPPVHPIACADRPIASHLSADRSVSTNIRSLVLCSGPAAHSRQFRSTLHKHPRIADRHSGTKMSPERSMPRNHTAAGGHSRRRPSLVLPQTLFLAIVRLQIVTQFVLSSVVSRPHILFFFSVFCITR